MKKKTKDLITIIGLIATLIIIYNFISLIIETPDVDIIPPSISIFNDNSPLILEIRNKGKPHFKFCVNLSSSKDIELRKNYDCYEFLEKGEKSKIYLSINETFLFDKNPKNFTLVFSSNTNWKYECLLEKKADNFYGINNCNYL